MNSSAPIFIAAAVLATGGLFLYSMNSDSPQDKKHRPRKGGAKRRRGRYSKYDIPVEDDQMIAEDDLSTSEPDDLSEEGGGDVSDEDSELNDEDLDASEYVMSDDEEDDEDTTRHNVRTRKRASRRKN
jgi:hypothetical protein